MKVKLLIVRIYFQSTFILSIAAIGVVVCFLLKTGQRSRRLIDVWDSMLYDACFQMRIFLALNAVMGLVLIFVMHWVFDKCPNSLYWMTLLAAVVAFLLILPMPINSS